MPEAADNGHLYIDLAGASIVRTEGTESSAVVHLGRRDTSIASLEFRTSPSGRWRVRHVVAPGFDIDDDSAVFVVGQCWALRVYPNVECPSDLSPTDALSPEVSAEIERLREEAGDDINKQITNTQLIQALINEASPSDATLCSAMQGNATIEFERATEEVIGRAQELLSTTCPGAVELLSSVRVPEISI